MCEGVWWFYPVERSITKIVQCFEQAVPECLIELLQHSSAGFSFDEPRGR
jgi:hypothetical protein